MPDGAAFFGFRMRKMRKEGEGEMYEMEVLWTQQSVVEGGANAPSPWNQPIGNKQRPGRASKSSLARQKKIRAHGRIGGTGGRKFPFLRGVALREVEAETSTCPPRLQMGVGIPSLLQHLGVRL